MSTRKSPKEPAKEFKNRIKTGLDKRKWKSTKYPCGTKYVWRRVDTKCKAEGTCKPTAKCPKVSIFGRKSPARPAKEFPGQTKKGLDGLYWVSSLDSRGYYTWRRSTKTTISKGFTYRNTSGTPHVCKIHTNAQKCDFDPNCNWTARGCIRRKDVLSGDVYAGPYGQNPDEPSRRSYSRSSAPTYSAPSYTAPISSYSAPATSAPTYSAPSYTAPATNVSPPAVLTKPKPPVITRPFAEGLSSNVNNGGKIVACCVLEDYELQRNLLIREIPKNEKYNYHPKQQKVNPKCQGYYSSTDTSNERGYSGVYFPFVQFGRYGTNEILIKYTAYTRLRQKKETRPIPLKPWAKTLCTTLNGMFAGTGRCESDEKESCCGFEHFISKFGEWWQVRQSAQIPGEFWERSDVKVLRDIALNYNWDAESDTFIQDETPLSTYDTAFDTECSKVIFRMEKQFSIYHDKEEAMNVEYYKNVKRLQEWLVSKGLMNYRDSVQ